MKLSITQIAGLAANAGFSGSDLTKAVAIALAESGGDPTAYNPERAAGAVEGRGSYGLWQIYITAHPEYNAAELLDPQTNANAAYSVYLAAGSSFHPWSTFKNGRYLAYTDSVGQTLAQAGDGGQGSSGPDGTDFVAIAIALGLALWLWSRVA